MKNRQGETADISGGENEVPSLENIGSPEFYQRKKQPEEADVPALKKGVKVEMVKKEEIYEDKIEKRAAFIASLGRKKTEEEGPENDQPDYVEEKSSLGKKIFFAALISVILSAIAGGGYFWLLKKSAADPSGGPEKNKSAVVIPANPETSPDNSATEKNTDEKNQIAEVAPAEMSVKVLNAGAAAGSAGKAKTLLVGRGYIKTEAGNGQGENVVSSSIYYKGEQFKKTASAIKEILAADKIKAEIKEALTAEQQSADVVVELGKT